MQLSKRKSLRKVKRYTEQNAHGASSKWGQMIGEAFAHAVIVFLEEYLADHHPDFMLLQPAAGRVGIRLEMPGGTARQLDNVIAPINSDEPVALFETKWLKDARHHNDKGAWILQLKEIRKKYATVRGAVAIVAGYWTEGVGVMFESEAEVQTILVATDEEVYETLRMPINHLLNQQGLPPVEFNVSEIRNSLPRPHDLANSLMDLKLSGELGKIAQGWFDFPRAYDTEGNPILGRHWVMSVIDTLLQNMPESPRIQSFEIALQIEGGNIIYQEFTDLEEALEFMLSHHKSPQKIRDKITPKRRAP